MENEKTWGFEEQVTFETALSMWVHWEGKAEASLYSVEKVTEINSQQYPGASPTVVSNPDLCHMNACHVLALWHKESMTLTVKLHQVLSEAGLASNKDLCVCLAHFLELKSCWEKWVTVFFSLWIGPELPEMWRPVNSRSLATTGFYEISVGNL